MSRSALDRLTPAPALASVSARTHHVIAFIGGSGGVGASVIATAVANLAGETAVLIDLDPLGGGVDLLLASEAAPGQRWNELQHVRGPLDHTDFRPIKVPGGPDVLSHGRSFTDVATAAACAVIEAARHDHSLVVLDLPRHFADHDVLGLVDELFLVVGGNVRACASASINAQRLMKLHHRVSAVVRTSNDAIRIAEFLHLPLAAEVLWEPRLDHDIDSGIAPGSHKRRQLHVGAEQILMKLDSQSPARRRRAS